MKVYVDVMPTTMNDCPFANENNLKCSITKQRCAFVKGGKCENLIDLDFNFHPDGEENSNGLTD